MKRKGRILLLLVAAVGIVVLAGCGKNYDDQNGTGKLKVGMVTTAGTLDDKSFNQGTWEGLNLAGRELALKVKHLRPAGTTTADYEREFANLHDAGYRLIVAPGFKFANALYAAQYKYPDTYFVHIDGIPSSERDQHKAGVSANSAAIFFAEQESGFLAGLAAALQVRSGRFGFIGGMETPPVQKYNWGFQQGVAYANTHFQTAVHIQPEHVVYQGTFSDVAAGQQLAAQMYDKGVTVIFAAAGSVGTGVIHEAVSRAKAGKRVWVVGVDVDQYADGIYNRSENRSVILTSAMKYIHQAAYDMVVQAAAGKFPGGQVLLYDAKNHGIGIPVDNPNLSAATVAQVQTVEERIKQGRLSVRDKGEGLIK